MIALNLVWGIYDFIGGYLFEYRRGVGGVWGLFLNSGSIGKFYVSMYCDDVFIVV